MTDQGPVGAEQQGSVVELVYHNVTVFSDGTYRRTHPTLVPACPSPLPSEVASKDLTLNSSHATLVRLYLPPCCTSSPHKLPILLYFHGGGFLNFSTAVPMYHAFLCRLATHTRALIVSVDYRLAPENPLPAAYEDCFAALMWLNEQAKPGCSSADPWLVTHGDFSRCFLGGDSAGANIVHHVAMEAVGYGAWKREKVEARHDVRHISLEGMILIHPFFTCGTSETYFHKVEDRVWRHSGVHEKVHPFANPFSPDLAPLRSAPLPRIHVAVASEDGLRKRGIAYHEGLVEAGKTAKLFTTENEGHVFQIFNPLSKNVPPFLDELCNFIHNTDSVMT